MNPIFTYQRSTSVLSMVQNNILDPHFVDIFPHMPPEQQRQGVDILKVECTKIEGAGSIDAQLAMMGQSDATSLPEDERKAIVVAGLDQCYWQLTKFLRVSNYSLPTIHRTQSTHFSYLAVFNPFTNQRSSTLYKEGSCSLCD
jgi:hypothetical protein